MTGVFVDAGTAPVAERRRLHVGPGSDESLLFDVLEEVIFTLDTAEAVPFGAEVVAAGDGGLDVTLLLADRDTVAATGAVPKAVSRSGFEVASRADVVRCRFLVDV